MHGGISRRSLLTQTGLAALGLAATPLAKALTACALTPDQPEGPFYPVTHQADEDPDLTRVEGHASGAKGQVVVVKGTVMGPGCRAIQGAMVEIWQACASGKYNHPDDPNTAPLDPDFQYWGRTTTDVDGAFSFRTIKPGAYPADADWIRPPHIHFRIAAPGYPTLTTQMYFDGEPLNGKDRFLRALTADQRELLIVPFQPAVPAEGRGVLAGRFDIVVGPTGARGVTPELD